MKTFFNSTALRKDITRFAPLWGLYTVFMLLFLLLLWESEGTSACLANIMPEVMAGMGVLNFFYALLCALLLYGDLFNPRHCNMLHALPLRRESWFCIHTLAGVLFCAVPNLLGCLIAAALLGPYCYMAFMWLGLMLLEFLFFFGVGSFSAMCAGTKLGAAAVYTIINLLSVVAAWLLVSFYEPLLYGITINAVTINHLSPVVTFTDAAFLVTQYDNMTSTTILERIGTEAWIYAAVAAAVGAGFLAISLVIYRRRAMETAGDMISLKPVAPVLLVIYTLCLAATLYIYPSYVFLAAGLIIGFFTGRMLLEKRVQVFHKKNFLAFGIFLLVFGLSLGLTKLDPLGITRYVPEAEAVESITLSPYTYDYYMDLEVCTLTEPEDVQTLLQLHRDAIENPGQDSHPYDTVQMRYRLRSGKTLLRTYYLPESLGYTNTLLGFYSRPETVFEGMTPETVMENTELLDFYTYGELPLPYICVSRSAENDLQEKYGDAPYLEILENGNFANNSIVRGLMDAIYADCLAGTMSQWQNPARSVGQFYLLLSGDSRDSYLSITVYENSENTLAYLQALAAEAQ